LPKAALVEGGFQWAARMRQGLQPEV
jgi:hypothetical protein